MTALRYSAADVKTATTKAFITWACAMPVAAAQLVLATAAEDGVLVADFGFASKLPLAASGAERKSQPLEPTVRLQRARAREELAVFKHCRL